MRHDVLIVGAGPTGLVLALWLAKQGIRPRTFSIVFVAALRSARRQIRINRPSGVNSAQLISGVAFASRALGIATLLSVSGVSLGVLAISALLDIDTPRQFGSRMRAFFGTRLHVKGSEKSETFEQLLHRLDPPPSPPTAFSG